MRTMVSIAVRQAPAGLTLNNSTKLEKTQNSNLQLTFKHQKMRVSFSGLPLAMHGNLKLQKLPPSRACSAGQGEGFRLAGSF